ncbi:methionine ABC transporter permease [Agromyces archimandritae]|uniref:ABC transporter permease n=1 Tax=Agromyces archimandritae TaxID=2781962 RepID=A0A975IMQ7_9MICO|nr:methionine ABC transporter permease [Agromyces archimandritae]QTX03773.1 ABC transporter permease [Agromyces archimandritae]
MTAKDDDFWNDLVTNPVIAHAVPQATGETLYMVLVALVIAIVFGVPLGVYLWNSSAVGLDPNRGPNRIVGAIVNVVRSLPFVILMVLLLPFTRLVAGTTLGPTASIVPLAIGAIPFLARLVEASLREVPAGKLEASIVCGAGKRRTIVKALLPEALPSIVSAFTTTAITLVAYSAMAGLVGGGGLGYLADAYGYKRFDLPVLIVATILLIVIVQLIQTIGDRVSRSLDHRSTASGSASRRPARLFAGFRIPNPAQPK